MGGTLSTSAGKTLTVSIAVHSPRLNSNDDRVRLDHVDVISGEVTGRIDPADPAYLTSETNPTTKVAKKLTKTAWKVESGWKVMTYKVKAGKDGYFRLRGTNLATGATNQTDAQGNPLVDTLDYVDLPEPQGRRPDDAARQHAGQRLGRPVVLQQPGVRRREVTSA